MCLNPSISTAWLYKYGHQYASFDILLFIGSSCIHIHSKLKICIQQQRLLENAMFIKGQHLVANLEILRGVAKCQMKGKLRPSPALQVVSHIQKLYSTTIKPTYCPQLKAIFALHAINRCYQECALHQRGFQLKLLQLYQYHCH